MIKSRRNARRITEFMYRHCRTPKQKKKKKKNKKKKNFLYRRRQGAPTTTTIYGGKREGKTFRGRKSLRVFFEPDGSDDLLSKREENAIKQQKRRATPYKGGGSREIRGVWEGGEIGREERRIGTLQRTFIIESYV